MINKETALLFGENGSQNQGGLKETFRRAGLVPGDIAMIHSRLFTLGKINPALSKEELLNAFIGALKETVGAEGTLIFAAFTLSVCQAGIFNFADTKSEMGILSEEARLSKDSARTKHPIYSVAIIGKHKKVFEKANISTCFGENSIFDLLHRINNEEATMNKVKFLTIGIDTPPEALTFIHYIEEKMKVPYRYYKDFKGTIIDDESETPYDVRFFVRDLSASVIFDKEACWDLLRTKNIGNVQQLGRSRICLLPEQELHDTIVEAIQKQNDFLCKGGYKPGKEIEED